MEEEVGIKVTRLRRRLSVEADDVKSPSTQSTPTKKRGGRLAAKPQLELIDENATETASKRTRKSTARDIAEPVDEKAVTPSRRSTRIRSNTSNVSETPVEAPEDKGTPSRRSTRIKSNTSIVAETVNVNSPRAKRAARRTSQVGSDSETAVTPTRQTRRTRKDSTSSVEKQSAEPNAGKLGGQVNTIVEESENNDKETNSTDNPKIDSPTPRKSPRLIVKTSRKSSSLDNDNKENQPQSDIKTIEITEDVKKSESESKSDQKNEANEQNLPEPNNLSVSSTNLLKELDEAPKKGKYSIMNKSTTAVEKPQVKSKRNRTKSWTTISIEPSNENSFCSDSETLNKKNNTLNLSNITGSGDGIINTSHKKAMDVPEHENVQDIALNSFTLTDKKKKKRHDKSMTIDTEASVPGVVDLTTSVNLCKTMEQISETKEVTKSKESQNLNVSKKHDSSMTEKLFEQAPSDLIQSVVYSDSDSNHGSNEKEKTKKYSDSEDQCVPVIDHDLRDSETPNPSAINVSYEPMDIDETMPENESLSTFSEKNSSTNFEGKESGLEKRKSLLNISKVKNDSINKSKRKSAKSEKDQDNSVVEESNKSFITGVVNNEVNKNLNKSKRKSSASNVDSEDTTDSIFNVFNRKSAGEKIDDSDSKDKTINKSKRKSSISNMTVEDNIDVDPNKSLQKTSSLDKVNDVSINKQSNKSKRKSSISNFVPDDSIDNSDKSVKQTCITDLINEEQINKSVNKSKRKSSISVMATEVSMDKIKPLIIDQASDDTNKSQRKSSTSNDDNMNKSSNKSKTKFSISPHMESQTFDKTANDNSTLVLSQIKNDSEINVESNPSKDNNESKNQLSQSVNVPNVNIDNESDKKNLSLTYLTSTPLQQKSIKQLGMQINSSIIAPNSESKVEKKNTLNMKKDISILSQGHDSDSNEESENESSLDSSKMIDDEAEEASDDYESGDSRDEDEKEYEEQNEIVEKGETLDSDDENEYSDDSDYEKDSFIVSSDAEDNDLLSGSGDDLSMSADELSMSAKSKKKYNDRKIKEQKKASKEMFEARHKLNNSDKNNKSAKLKIKKNNRQCLDSSSSDSDEGFATQPKSRRQRIDSSQDLSMDQSDADRSVSKKKKKTKRLSESVCSDSVTNEKEITIRDENETDKIDPLALKNVVKEEPKTPQKDINISTVAITNTEEVEEVNIDENLTILKPNQTLDPLQATITQDEAENDEDEDSISENEEITQNYESVLCDLNKSGSKKIKTLDISLNINKKPKQLTKEPIVDQLNLTQTKKSRKNDVILSEDAKESKNLNKSLNKSTDKVNKKTNDFSEASSDSIDMKLLFPEDSNDSEILVKIDGIGKNQKYDETTQKKEVQEAPDDFIPLKKSEGKTNMLENINTANKSKDKSILNVSKKGKTKRKSLQTEEAIAMHVEESDNVSFFIDTTGTHTDENKTDVNTSIKNSTKKNKHKNNVSFVNVEEANNDEDSNEAAPLEVSYLSEKNKDKSIQESSVTQNGKPQVDSTVIETPNQSAKKKKKNKKGLNSSQNVTDISLVEHTDDLAGKSVNTSTNKGDGSTKKKKKMIESEVEQEGDDVTEKSIDTSAIKVSGSAKKKKKISEAVVEQETENDASSEPVVENVSLGSSKKKKKQAVSESSAAENEDGNKDDENVINNEEIPKKRKRKSSSNQTIEEIITQDDMKLDTSKTIINESLKSKKKKRKISHNDKDVEIQAHEATKKNKKRKERDDDDVSKISKILKQDSFEKVHVPRLPINVLKHLHDKPKKDIAVTKDKVISTTSFLVEETKKRRNKPSNYLEESVYLNDNLPEKRQKHILKKPKVLPFIPTASTSEKGFTTNFRVNIIPQQTQFVAQSNDVSNFKNDYLHQKRIKKLGTFEMYKRQRNIKISKF